MFTAAYAPTSHTLPSVSALMTGLYPEEAGIVSNDSTLAANVPTLATALRGAGWRTQAVVSNWVLRRSSGLASGFDVYDDTLLQREATRPMPERIAADTTTAALRAIDDLPSGARGALLRVGALPGSTAPTRRRAICGSVPRARARGAGWPPTGGKRQQGFRRHSRLSAAARSSRRVLPGGLSGGDQLHGRGTGAPAGRPGRAGPERADGRGLCRRPRGVARGGGRLVLPRVAAHRRAGEGSADRPRARVGPRRGATTWCRW